MDCEVWLEKCIDEFSADSMIKRLNLPKVKQRIIDAGKALSAYTDAVDDWEFPLVFTPEKKNFDKLVQEFTTAVKATWRHVDAINSKRKEKSKKENNVKGGRRGARNKLKDHMEGRDIPEGPAKVVADTAWSWISPPSELNITLPYESPTCEITVESTLHDFDKPFVVRYDAAVQEGDLSYYESLFGSIYRDLHGIGASKMREMVNSMRSSKGVGASTTLNTYTTFDPNLPTREGNNTGWFDIAKIKPGIMAAHTETLEVDPVTQPFRRLPQWLQVLVGACVCIAVKPEDVPRVGDLSQWLASCDSAELGRHPTWYLREGDAVFSPPGYHLLNVGIPISIKMDKVHGVDLKGCKDNQHHSYALGCYVMFDESWLESLPVAVKGTIATWWGAADGDMPDSWKKNEKYKKCKKIIFRLAGADDEEAGAGALDVEQEGSSGEKK